MTGDTRSGGSARQTTLGDLVAQGRKIWAWCNGCGHNATLAADTLATHLGGGFPVPRVGRHMRCGQCGGRDVDTRPDWPRGGVGASHRWHGD